MIQREWLHRGLQCFQFSHSRQRKQCGQVQAKSAFSANQCKKASQGGEARCKACVKASG